MNELEVAPTAFDKLLLWLSPNREVAADRYEELRVRLVRLFSYRGSVDPEGLTDLVFDRVLSKIDDTTARFEGDPARHFLAVANFIFLENRRLPISVELPENVVAPSAEDDSERIACLRKCLALLPDEKRRLILDYYRADRRDKIERRQRMADQRGISVANLHSKAFRIRAQLMQCGKKCISTGKCL